MERKALQIVAISFRDGSQLLISDSENHRIRSLDIGTLEVSHVAGSGIYGLRNDDVSAAEFRRPSDVIEYQSGVYLVTDTENNVIRKIQNGNVHTWVGSGRYGHVDGNGNATEFKHPTGLVRDSNGNVFVVDKFNHCIRKITPDLVVSTIAGKYFWSN